MSILLQPPNQITRRAVAATLLPIFGAHSETRTVRQRKVEIKISVRINAVPSNHPVSLWLPVPHNDESQSISNLHFTIPAKHQIASGAYANQYLHCQPTRESTVEMTFQATRFEHILRPEGSHKHFSDQGPNCCLGPDRLVPIDNQIRQWANEVTAGQARTDVEKARAIYNHIIATVKYDKNGKGWGRGDIYYACDARRGNCTDFHAIFIGYCRAVGVPARFAIGLPLPPSRGSGEISGYHCWAEFYARGYGWIPIDASEAGKDPSRREYFFGAHDENRIEFSRGRDLVLNPKQQSDPLNFFVVPYAELEGKPFAGISTQTTYRDL